MKITLHRLIIAAASTLLFSASSLTAATVTATYDPVDSTDEIRAAIDAAGPGGTVIIPYRSTPWYVKPDTNLGATYKTAIILNKANLQFVMEQGVVIKAIHGNGAFQDSQSKLMIIVANGVTVRGEGTGATLEMNRDLYSVSPYTTAGGFRHTLQIGSFSNITVQNVISRNSGGDGILLGSYNAGSGINPTTIVFDNVRVFNPMRLGFAVTSVDGLTIKNCSASGAKGENPESGIDIEPDPNKPWAVIKNVLVENSSFNNNNAHGIKFEIFNYFGTGVSDVSVTFRNCDSIGNAKYGVQLGAVKPANLNEGAKGTITLQDVYVAHSGYHGLILEHFKVGYAPTVSVGGCTFYDVGTAGSNYNPIYFNYGQNGYKLGGVSFVSYNSVPNLIVDRTYSRGNINAEAWAKDLTNGKGFKNITGTIEVASVSSTFLDLNGPTNFENVTVTRATPSTNTNLLANPSFESSLTTWTVQNSNAYSVLTKRTGIRGVRFGSASGGITSARVPVTAGTSYKFDAWVVRYASTASATVGVRFYNASGAQLSNPTTAVNVSDAWTKYTITAAAPSGAATAEVYFTKPAGGVDNTFYGDDFSLVKQ